MDTEVDSSTFTDFNDFILHLFTCFSNHLLDTSRVNTSIDNELMQSEAGNFTTHGVETGKNDSFRSIVDDNFNTGSGFEGTNISTFAADNTSFNLVAIDIENGNGILYRRLCSYALDSLHNDTFSLFIGG